MAKRFALVFFLLLAVCGFLVAGFALMLFLAPGFRAFGLKYIASDTHIIDSGNVEAGSLFSGFRGDFEIETDQIPVYIIFTNSNIYQIRYFDNFNGLTTSDFDDPKPVMTTGSDGTAIIKTQEFDKFLYESSSSERYLKIFIPLSKVNGTDLKITTNSAPVTFMKEDTTDLRIPYFSNLTISTYDKINYDTAVKAIHYDLAINDSINVSNKSKIVEATNYTLYSRNGRITIQKDVIGDLDLTTRNQNISIVSCGNLTAKSTYGNLTSASDENEIIIDGSVNIDFKTGNVRIGEINGTTTNVIKTTSGNVSIDKLKNAEITTQRGAVRIESLNKATISTNVGKVEVYEVLSSIDVTTKRGKIVLGSEDTRVNNPTAFSRLGKVTVSNATGKVDLHTIRSDIKFTNSSSSNITINAGGALDAKGLTGTIKIAANDETTLEFSYITAATTIELGDSCKSATITALRNTKNNTRYYIEAKNVTRYEYDTNTGSYSKVEAGTAVTNTSGSGPLLNVTSKNADILVYFLMS